MPRNGTESLRQDPKRKRRAWCELQWKGEAELYFAMQRNGKSRVAQCTEKAITELGGFPAERIIK